MLKAKTFVKEVPRDSGLGRIYSYRYKKKKSDNKGIVTKKEEVTAPGPSLDPKLNKPSPWEKEKMTAVNTISDPDFKSGYKQITPKQYKEPDFKSGYKKITPKQYKEPETGVKPARIYRITPKASVKKLIPKKKKDVPTVAPKAAAKVMPVKKKVKGEVDLFGPTKTKFIPPKHLDRETKGFDPLSGIPKGITRKDLGLKDKQKKSYDVPRYLDRETKGFDTGVPKGITRKDLGLKDKPKKSYGVPKLGAKFIPKKGGPYSNAQHDQLVKSDIKVGGADLRLKSMAAIGALGAGAIGLGKILPSLGKILPSLGKLLPKRPRYRTKGTPNPKDPMNIIHTPPIPKLLKRPVKTKATKLKTPKSMRAEDYVTRRTAKELYKRIFPRGKYDGKIVKTPKKVLKKFQNRKK